VKQKGFVLLPVIIIIVLLSVVGYSIYENTQLQKSGGNTASQSNLPTQNLPKPSTTPDPTVNWKTYTNKDLSIRFKYPENEYTIKNDTESEMGERYGSGIPNSFIRSLGYSPPRLVSAIYVESKKSYSDRYGKIFKFIPFDVWVFDNSQGLSVKNWCYKYGFYPFSFGKDYTSDTKRCESKNEILIDNKKALYSESSVIMKEILLPTQGYMFVFDTDTTDWGNNTSFIADQILFSFKFTQ